MDTIAAILSLVIAYLGYGIYNEIVIIYCPNCGSNKIIIHEENPKRSYNCINCNHEF